MKMAGRDAGRHHAGSIRAARTSRSARPWHQSSKRSPLPFSGNEPPYRAHYCRIDLFGEVEHADKTFESLFSFVVVVAKPHTKLVRNRAFLYSTYKNVNILLLEK
jgi:hypothetical protein